MFLGDLFGYSFSVMLFWFVCSMIWGVGVGGVGVFLVVFWVCNVMGVSNSRESR